ncbi:MAG TPA: helicase-associated domain-containing protein, partial [Gemmataceae bacterium]|nr:helicase-associated domain-containing protein [Gemmataceae bacterium]
VEQTLLVQPNLEIVLFRQGLTPALIARLSRFAVWKTLGLACTLQLTAESVYHGLEGGETLADLIALFERHGTRDLSETVLGSLRSWASKRERVLVFPAALLLEFRTPGELDRALGLGLVERRVNDRIGLIASEDRINYVQFRFVGTRDYLAPEELCAAVEDDGLVVTVNENRSDLLLDSEVRQFAVPAGLGIDERPRYRLTPETLRAARGLGMDARSLDDWFRRRTGEPLPPAARLLLTGDETGPLSIQRLTVLQLPSAEIADGMMAWSETREFVSERLSPTVLAIPAEAVAGLRQVLGEIGIRIDG